MICNSKDSTTISRFLYKSFRPRTRERPLNFFVSTIHQVIWPTPGPESWYPRGGCKNEAQKCVTVKIFVPPKTKFTKQCSNCQWRIRRAYLEETEFDAAFDVLSLGGMDDETAEEKAEREEEEREEGVGRGRRGTVVEWLCGGGRSIHSCQPQM